MVTPEITVDIPSVSEPGQEKEVVLDNARKIGADLWGRQAHPETGRFAEDISFLVPDGRSRYTIATLARSLIKNYQDPDAGLGHDLFLSTAERAVQEMGPYLSNNGMEGMSQPAVFVDHVAQESLLFASVWKRYHQHSKVPSRLVTPSKELVKKLGLYDKGRALDQDDGRGRGIMAHEAIQLTKLARPTKELSESDRLNMELGPGIEPWTRRCEIQVKRPIFDLKYFFDTANLPPPDELAMFADHKLTAGVLVPWDLARMLANGRRSARSLEEPLATIKSGAHERFQVVVGGDEKNAPKDTTEATALVEAISEIMADEAA